MAVIHLEVETVLAMFLPCKYHVSVSPSIPGAGRPALFAFLKVILFYIIILYIVELQLPFSIFY